MQPCPLELISRSKLEKNNITQVSTSAFTVDRDHKCSFSRGQSQSDNRDASQSVSLQPFFSGPVVSMARRYGALCYYPQVKFATLKFFGRVVVYDLQFVGYVRLIMLACMGYFAQTSSRPELVFFLYWLVYTFYSNTSANPHTMYSLVLCMRWMLSMVALPGDATKRRNSESFSMC